MEIHSGIPVHIRMTYYKEQLRFFRSTGNRNRTMDHHRGSRYHHHVDGVPVYQSLPGVKDAVPDTHRVPGRLPGPDMIPVPGTLVVASRAICSPI